MNAVVKGGVVLAVLVSLVSILLIATGLHENPLVGGLGSIAAYVVIDVAVVWWTLRQRAVVDAYGRQVLNGLLVGLLGAVLIFVLSMVITTVLFPQAMDEMKASQLEWMESMEMPEEALDAQIAKIEAATPMAAALQGAVFTVITSVIAAAIIGIFVRRKG